MSDSVRIELQPLNESVEVKRGTPLKDVLFAYGVEFPCGGHGRCRRCRVRLLKGNLPITKEQEAVLDRSELAAGWRLACHSAVEDEVTLEIAQWETSILDDRSRFDFVPGEGLGVAIDLGTTTVVAQLLDLRTAHVLAVRTALNSQAAHGADVMSRVQYAAAQNGQQKLERLIRQEIGLLLDQLQEVARRRGGVIRQVVVVGNTVMHHLFCGVDVEPLSHAPFHPHEDGLKVFSSSELNWELDGNPAVRFLPCLGGFVGSDILAGILATKLHESEELQVLVDLGTNGEIVVGNRERMLCASTAAGPAFEGGGILMGMRAATGAIVEVELENGGIRCVILGNVAPRGICGSGLVDAVAAGLELGRILPTGRFSDRSAEWMLAEPVSLSQCDIRGLQLAKGAISAGIRILLRQWGARVDDVTRLYLAGAFGNYVSRTSARRIGLIDFPEEKVQPAGNTALLGAKLALFGGFVNDGSFEEIRSRVQHVPLASDPEFEDTYIADMRFPSA